jgi:UrcA family protein
MDNPTSTHDVVVSRPKVTLLMILCGMVGATAVGAVSAATTGDDVPQIVVKFDAASLSDDRGTRTLYHRIVKAAEQVCPIVNERDLHRAEMARECRRQSIARAVHQINSPRLAEVHANHPKNS